MSSIVDLRREGEVAIITVDNPPVNAQNNAVRAGLRDALKRAGDDAAVAGVVLTCAGRTFIAGSDIAEFGKTPQQPTTPDVIAAIESMDKPVVAALFGTPMGGGLELALGCHFRIAAPDTRLALPEIRLGLIPGAGGTQRLPRLAGMDKAIAMILSGEPMAAPDALACGLIDEIYEGDPAKAGIDFVRRAVADRRPLLLARAREEKLAPLRDGRAHFAELAAKFTRRVKAGERAPAAALQALQDAIDLPIEDALKRERAAFFDLVDSEESKSLRHIFFAERAAAKAPALAAGAKPPEVARAAVIGAGTMGGGIAMCFANAGIPVTVVETTAEALAKGLGTIEKNYKISAARGALAAEDVDKRMALISGATEFSAVAEADLIVEAVFEDLEVKRQVFTTLDKIAKPGALIATNTSYLDIDAVATVTRRPEAVCGLHFFSPANVMRLLEIVRASKTAPEMLARALLVARRIGKIPVVVGLCHGFVGNRMLRRRSVEAERLLLEGAMPRQIDAAMVAFGFPMGPLAVSDLGGLDIGWRMRKAQGYAAPVADRLCEMGRFGQKTGRGFYLYEPGSRAPRPDAEVEELIVVTARKLGVARRAVSNEEIVERLIFPMVNEGARILAEGVAQRAGDIDVIWVHGYAFPAWRGGPMHYADTLGLGYVAERLNAFAAATGDESHRPAPLLAQLAAQGQSFTQGE